MTETKLTHITFRPSRGGASGLAVLVLPRRQRVGLPRLHPEPLHQPRASGLHARAHAGGRAAGLPRLPSAPLRARPLPARRGRTGHTHDDELRFELSAVDFFFFCLNTFLPHFRECSVCASRGGRGHTVTSQSQKGSTEEGAPSTPPELRKREVGPTCSFCLWFS